MIAFFHPCTDLYNYEGSIPTNGIDKRRSSLRLGRHRYRKAPPFHRNKRQAGQVEMVPKGAARFQWLDGRDETISPDSMSS